MAMGTETVGTARTGVQAPDRRNVGRLERLASVLGGGALAAYGLRRRDLPGWLAAVAGGALIVRGATGHCAVYDRFGVNRRQAPEGPLATAYRTDPLVTVMTIAKPADTLYAFWRDFANLPRVMPNLHRVRMLDATRAEWVAKAPFGASVAWQTTITEDEPGRRIAWRSLPDAEVASQGEIDFLPASGGRGTDVRLRLAYQPPGGRLVLGLARLFGEAPEQRGREDLRRFKQLMEAGEIISNAGPSCR